MGNWSLILQRNSWKLYKTYASDLSLLRVKGAEVFMTQFPSLFDSRHSCEMLFSQYFLAYMWEGKTNPDGQRKQSPLAKNAG